MLTIRASLHLSTGSHDKSLRRWERTQEPFFVEEEKEKRLESLFESDLDQQDRRDEEAAGGPKDNGEGLALPAGRRTLDSVGAADSIIEALEMAASETERQRQEMEAAEALASEAAPSGGSKGSKGEIRKKKVSNNPLMLGLSPSAYLLRATAMVKPSDLESALLMLPFNDALSLLSYIPEWIGGKGGLHTSLPGGNMSSASKGQRKVAAGGHHIELACRVAVLLLRLHHSQLVATTSARHVLLTLSRYLRPGVQALKDLAGFNLAGLGHLQRMQKEKTAAFAAEDDSNTLVKAKVAIGKK